MLPFLFNFYAQSSSSTSDAPISLEDQNRINNFSSKSVAMAFLEDRVNSSKKVLEANKDAIEELELVLDEEAKIP